MEFRILGPLEVAENGQTLDLGGPKQRALLAVLLLHAGEVVSTDRLIDALWEDDPPGTAQKALQVHVSGLRKILGRDRLETRPPGYVLRLQDGELDLERFGALRGEGKPAAALALLRGPPLAEFAYQRFALPEIARLEDLRLACLEERIGADLSAGKHAELVGELEALVQEQPLRERLRAQLMMALYRSGRQADALDAYQEARRALTDELGIEPGRELRGLHQQILNQDPALDLFETGSLEPARGGFVGRDEELAELLEGLEDALAGRGRLFLLVGEPGIGKSRLAEELAIQARARGARVLVGRCWEAGGAPAYWPWVQSLRTCARATQPEALREQLGAGAAELAQLLPELRELFPDLPEPPMLEAESARFRLFEAACSFLRSSAGTRPIVLVLDDLHAADEPSLLLLRFLARELRDSRLLVLAAYRDVDPVPTDPLIVATTELTREPIARSIALAGLGEREVRRFIELVSGETPAEELVASIHEETEGNPLFVGEIVRLLAAEGGLTPEGAPRIAIPQTVRDVIVRRLRHLSEQCNRTLVLASVLGREFELGALARLAALSEDELLDALDEAMAERIVSDLPGSAGGLRFAHVLIRDTLYEGLTTVRRVRLHRQAVAALELLYGDEPGPHLAELAHHSIAGSDFERGLLYARRAGDRALALLAYEEAAHRYRSALECGELVARTDEAARCDLLLMLGDAESRGGNTPEARRAFLEAADLARRLALPRELARAAVGYGGRIVFGRAGSDARLVPLLEEGLAAIGSEDVELRARLLARLAGALRDEHSRDRRDRLSREAVELARRAGELSALAYALDGRAVAIIAPDTIVECLALGTELCEVARRIGDAEREVYGHIHRFIAQLQAGDTPAAERDLLEAGRIAEELRQPTLRWQADGGKVMVALAAGRLDEADNLATRALNFGERAHDWLAVPVYWLQRYNLADFRGEELDELEQRISGLASQYPARPFLRAAHAHVQMRLGRTADARHTLHDLGRDDFAALPFDMEWPYAASVLTEVSVVLADLAAGSALYRLLLPWSELNVVDMAEGIRGSMSRYLGLLATMLERWGEAGRHFEAALGMNQRMGYRPWLACTQEDYGRLLLTRGETERGRALLDQALATYRELGMDGYAARAQALVETYA